MKHYLLSPEGLQRIADKDVASWLLHGSFMKSEGPIAIPSALGMPDVEQIELLLKRAENFVYWFSPDYRVAFTTKDGRGWKIRFEMRGEDKSGKAVTQAARVNGKVKAHGVVKTIAEVFQRHGSDIEPIVDMIEESSPG